MIDRSSLGEATMILCCSSISLVPRLRSPVQSCAFQALHCAMHSQAKSVTAISEDDFFSDLAVGHGLVVRGPLS